jgi:hypothetical protein
LVPAPSCVAPRQPKPFALITDPPPLPLPAPTLQNREVKGVDLPRPFPRLTYADAMARYGSDKPDTRFGLEFTDVSEAVAGCGFRCAAGGAQPQLVRRGGTGFLCGCVWR